MKFNVWILFIAFIISCSSPTIENNSILAKVGSRTITKQDFIRRAEYTLRPDYCRNSNYIHKKIILNSLIAEKLFALESEKSNSELFDNPNFKSFVQGRKEQAMRQIHYVEEFYNQTKPNSRALTAAYKMSGRTVDLTYLNMPDLNSTERLLEIITNGVSLDSAYSAIWRNEHPPQRQLNWFDRESQEIHKSVFRSEIKKGDIIGPMVTDEKTYLLIQINGWTDRPAMAESEKTQRMLDVRERLKENEAKKQYKSWVSTIMSGKQLELNPDVFPAYAERVKEYYLQSDSVKQSKFNVAIWDDPEFDFTSDLTETKHPEKLDETNILFKIDGNTTTIKSFHNQLQSHPLVFRKKKMNRAAFPQQLRLAIADLVRDIEIKKYCYEKGYGTYPSVILNEQLWSDAYLARDYRHSIIESEKIKDSNPEYYASALNPIVDSLQAVYSKIIELNMNNFESIELTSVDMTVSQKGVPYPIMVPAFPIITTDNILNFGRRINP
ncbi:MAG: hypothetical protein H8E64_07190 [Candidatus Marinimicrobia bacterium]|nr:hypothetical protein [Candidatus Neomarinimicrobiota bacterium]